MLESIQITNFAIIDKLDLEFEAGLTALTGETGAGKSILLDAIKLIAGDRADSDTVKTGRDKAEICVAFNINQHTQAQSWLQTQDMSSAEECIIRRLVTANGRSKAYINGHNATLAQLKELSQLLVDLHGQQEHQSLQKPQVQQQLLDTYLSEPELIDEVKQKHLQWRNLERRLTQAQGGSQAREQRLELLRVYCDELAQLNLGDGEIDNLQAEYSRLSHAGSLIETVGNVLGLLYENDENTVQAALSHCEHGLAAQVAIDEKLRPSYELVSAALIQIQEASNELRDYQQSVDLDPGRLDWLNQRIANTQDLARKHHVTVEALPEFARALNLELEELDGGELNLDNLLQEVKRGEAEYLSAARQLSGKRAETAVSLSTQITQVMQQLGMEGGQFSIAVEVAEANTNFRASGIDSIVYLVSANPGQPLKPLSKVASGGELSRISLAIQVILCESSNIPTLIFDEVDSGVGGGIAEIVGNKLRLLGDNRQVFCVTHLPQVASQAHHHFRVEKTKTAEHTSTEVVALEADERLEEIARMLGGVKITDQTRAHASEMIGTRQVSS